MVSADGIRQIRAPNGAASGLDAARVLDAVTDIVRDVCADPTIKLTPETQTDAIPAWEETTRAGIAVEAECRFQVLFQAQEVVQLRTIGDLLTLIASKRASLHD